MKRFEGKVCVVTGGALGIGRCLTREFAKEGAKVAFIDINKRAGEENLSFIQERGGNVIFCHGDIGEEVTLNSFVETVINAYGKIDYLINNACISKNGILTGCSYDDFNYVLRVGVTAPYMLSKLFLPYFSIGGSIINIASTRAFMSQSDTESYSAAKGGILALTHALAVSLKGKVRVNSISPGWIDTGEYYDENYVPEYSDGDIKQHLVERVGNPMDIARVAMFLCHEENDFITGENITVDGGMTKLMIYSGDEGWDYKGE
ncbi:MAG: SDR family oxidoreductase [Clostridiales bacterium]|nr:SDR family oxidoreductase [Clostridiales bacterium]